MPFHAPYDEYFEDIFEPAVRAAGLRALRADSVPTSTVITDDIYQMAANAKVLLADLSTSNANVFWLTH